MSALDQLLAQLADPSQLAWNEETYDLALASTLDRADLATYVEKLIANARQGDTHAILTLGHLGAAEAVPMLRAAATSSDPWAATARRAMVLLGHGGEVLDAVVNDALHGGARMGRVAAVMALPQIGGPKAVAALGQALEDPDSTVRMIAWNALIAALDLEPFMRGPSGKLEKGTRLELLKDFLASDSTAMAKIGADEIRTILGHLADGASPVILGITYQPDPAPAVSDAIVQAIVDRDVPYPVEEIAKLSRLARRWGEAALALRIESQDERVPDALVRLGASWTIPVLEEVAQWPSTSEELRVKLLDAARQLATS